MTLFHFPDQHADVRCESAGYPCHIPLHHPTTAPGPSADAGLRYGEQQHGRHQPRHNHGATNAHGPQQRQHHPLHNDHTKACTHR